MEFLQLEYFVELAHSEHLTKTAEKYYVNASAVSSSMARLEAELGCQLFDRVGRGIVLNENGRSFLHYAETILYQKKQALTQLEYLKNNRQETLIVGMWHPSLQSRTISAFRHLHPDINLKVALYDPLMTSTVPTDRFDLFMAPMGSFDNRNWISSLFFQDEVLIALSPNHPLADRDTIALTELRDERFIFTFEGSFNEYCKNLCRQAGFFPEHYYECEYTARADFIRRENYVGLTTHSAFVNGLMEGISLAHIANHPYRYQSIHCPAVHTLSPAGELFIRHVIDFHSGIPPFDRSQLSLTKTKNS